MLIIGCDYHPSVQQIAWVDTETGACGERRLTHSGGEAEQFYRELKKKGISVRVRMEATGHSRWFDACSRSSTLSCGWAIRRRFEPSGYASRRTTGEMPSIFSS